MKKSNKTITIKVTRIIAGSQKEVFNAWMNPKNPGNNWHDNKKLIFNPKVDGMFFWLAGDTPHYGRFTKISSGKQVQHTWMSPYTLGKESKVTVTFKKKGNETEMTLLHTGLPDDEMARGHDEGWGYFMDLMVKHFKKSSSKKK